MWMNSGDIMLSDIHQTQKDKSWCVILLTGGSEGSHPERSRWWGQGLGGRGTGVIMG